MPSGLLGTLAASLLLLQGCSTSMSADLSAPSATCRRSALRALQDLEAVRLVDADEGVEGVLKDGRSVRIDLDPLNESGTRVRVTVGRGETAEDVAEAVRIIEKMADGVDR